MSNDPSFVPRRICARCRRPESVCYCRHLTSIDTATRVVVLQHPREEHKPIGTAYMASLCLPNSELHVGVEWEESRVLERVLGEPSRPAWLLYPGEGATNVQDVARGAPITLVVVDGTWSQTRKMVHRSPRLARLPRLAFSPPRPSEYRIRREPEEHCVSTIEALMYVLGALEGAPERFEGLLTPFRAMVDSQIECRSSRGLGRIRLKKNRHPALSPIPAEWAQRCQDLLCVIGEANAWPYCARHLPEAAPDELIHFAAHRVGTAESLSCIVAPRACLAPNTLRHVELSEPDLRGGASMTELLERWEAFVRPTDLVCCWGRYTTSLFVAAGGHFPCVPVDVREIARAVARRHLGTIEEFAASLYPDCVPGLGVEGRAGRRLSQLVAVVAHFAARAQNT
jgi:DTW domain-containing protein